MKWLCGLYAVILVVMLGIMFTLKDDEAKDLVNQERGDQGNEVNATCLSGAESID